MKPLIELVSIRRRFSRSARIDVDLNGTPPLVGYVLQSSVAKALLTMTTAQTERKQGAFTWTGPYGGGKSSAALLVANLIAGEPKNQNIAQEISGQLIKDAFSAAFPEEHGKWSVIAITGSRCALRSAIADGASATFGWEADTVDSAKLSDKNLLDALEAAPKSAGGTLIILDELGKLLEHEAGSGGDIHLLQDIAERASRSNGKLVVIGILHQSFDQYAARAARDSRNEWAKVQGRYQDIAFLSGADETIALLGQAISASVRPDSAGLRAEAVAKAVAQRRPTDTKLLGEALVRTWPLNPVTALLLGPMSRQRFAQNERSLFGFLSSAEPHGFQEFLSSTDSHEVDYGPAALWDYLAANFGMALASGSDGRRFSLAFEAIERAGAKGTELHVQLTKSAATIELFRNGSGLAVADEFLQHALCGVDTKSLTRALSDLVDWSILIRQPRLGGYALFAGSDFDLDEAINRALSPLEPSNLTSLIQRSGFNFATAKRHYFRTGVLRTFEIKLYLVGRTSSSNQVAALIANSPARGSGVFALLVNDGDLTGPDVDSLAKSVAKELKTLGVIAAVAGTKESYALRSSAKELLAVERVFHDHPQLEGDRIARREIAARQSACIDQLNRNIQTSLSSARWWLSPKVEKTFCAPLTFVASALSDLGFPCSPILKSELLQRDKISSNAMAALRELCHAMVLRSELQDLGIKGYPAEMGLYLTVLQTFGLHKFDEIGRGYFAQPDETDNGQSLAPAWGILEASHDFTASSIYQIWCKPPFGMKAGTMPVLLLAYLLANISRVAAYIDGSFQATIDDVFVDKLLQRPESVRLRHIDRSVRETAFLSELAHHFKIKDDTQSLPVASALFQAFERLPAYSSRTNTISEESKKIRNAVLAAKDPEALLFEALPSALGDILSPTPVIFALKECQEAYPLLLLQMRAALARALGVDVNSFAGLKERAATVFNLTNDYNFDAFAQRAAAFESDAHDIESLVSLLVHRPAQSWSDRDREQAFIEMANYGRRFRELEALAVVRDRKSNTEAVAIVVGIDPLTLPLLQSFELTEIEKKEATALAKHVLNAMTERSKNTHIKMAALARAVASLVAQKT